MLGIKEILRLKCEAKLSNRKIARVLNISHSVVNDYLKEFKLTNKRYEDITSLNDKEILALLKATRTRRLTPEIDTFSLLVIFYLRIWDDRTPCKKYKFIVR